MWLEAAGIAILSLYTILIFVTIVVLLFPEKEDDPRNFIPTEKVSIIIPFRNEAENILACLEGLVVQDYPAALMEIILADDHSEDNSQQLATNFLRDKSIAFKLIDLKEYNLSGKKNAIEYAVSQVSGSIIITRDADTYTENKLWLKSMLCLFKDTKTDLVLGPLILSGSSFIQTFQQFENVAITCMSYAFAKTGFPFVCSGANLAYRKEAFLKTNPYQNNKHVASGDDMFLLQRFIEEGLSISTTKNKDAVVYTKAERSFSGFISQRLRWASKAKNLHIKTAWFIGAVLFLSNLILLIIGIYSFFGGINVRFCLFALIYKCIIEFLLLFLGRFMYKQKLNLTYYIPAFIANLFYVPVISLASVMVKSKWKGRKQHV